MFLLPQGRMARLAFFLSMMSVSLAIQAQSVAPEDEFRERTRVTEDIKPLGENAFGESVSLYNGALSFRQTDIDLAGTGPRLQLVRTLGVADDALRGLPNYETSLGFADWELEIPHIETLSANVGGNSPTAPVTWFFQDDPNRCSALKQAQDIFISRQVQFDGAGPPFHYAASSWWHGYKLVIPGLGDQDLLSRDPLNILSPQMKWSNGSAIAFNIVTLKHWQVACLQSTSNGVPGEGFLVVSPDGTKYWMDRLITKPASTMGMGISYYAQLQRHAVMMMTSRVEDRFGNYLAYSYDSMGNLTLIRASDGRSLTLTYDNQVQAGRVDTATLSSANGPSRTWKYNYTNSSIPGGVSMQLSGIQLPDGTAWAFDLSKFGWNDFDFIKYNHISDGSTDCIPFWSDTVPSVSVTIRSPTGLTGTFNISPMARGRSYVPDSCSPDENGDGRHHLAIPNVYPVVALRAKAYSGAGITGQDWTYSYSSPNKSWLSECANGCVASVWTDVTDPSANRTRYTFSNRFNVSESQLLNTDYYTGATGGALLRSVTSTYASATAGPWPTHLGSTLEEGLNSAQLEQLAPENQEVIAQDSDSFTWQAESFNIFAQVTKTKRFSSILGQGAVEEQVTYLNDLPHWALSLPLQIDNLTTGETVDKNVYDLSNVTLKERWRFGQKLMSYAFDSFGQLASFTDGNDNTTSLSNYNRGVPQLIMYPDSHSESLVVNDLGQISSVTDRAGRTTSYSYDLGGRLAQNDYPSGDEQAWNATVIATVPVGSAERGLGANHWRRTQTTGDAMKVTYFDALLRPVLTESKIAASAKATTLINYDAKGQKTFASYPNATPLDFTTTLTGIPGVTTAYDPLGRAIRVQQDSELGPLTSTMAYLSGARQQVTDPKGKVTTTSYQVFDTPSYDAPILVQAPAGTTQIIARDVYGNPHSITQAGLIKTLTYDNHKRLCRTTEPESGNEFMGYDGANNLAWTLPDATLSDDGSCHLELAQSTGVTTRTYDAMNRVLTILPPVGTGTQSTQYHYTPLGQPDQVVSGITTWTGAYNFRGMMTGESLQVDGQIAWGIGYAHDGNGSLSLIHYPDGENVSYAPDALGRPTQVGGYASGIGYFPNGQVSQFVYGNGIGYVADQACLDPKNCRQLLRNFSYGPGTSQLSEDLDYDANGNITDVTDATDGASGLRTKSFSYDDLNRLTQASAAHLWVSEAYTYDALNNLRSRTSGGQVYTYNYDPSNKLASITNGANTVDSFLYDNRGNVTGKNAAVLVFDRKNQLSQIVGYGSYAYDAAGRRVMKTPTGGTPTYYFYNQAGQLLYQLDADTLKSTNFIYLGTKLIARDEGVPAPTLTAPALSGTGNYAVSWSVVAAATNYILQEQSNGSSWSTIQSSNATSASITGKIDGSYGYRTQACNSVTCTPWSGTATTTVVHPPIVPASITVPATSNGSVAVSWAASSAATSYTLQQQLGSGGWSTVYTGAATSSTRVIATSGSYTYQVQACNAGGCSAYKVSSAVVVTIAPVGAPTLTVPATSSTGNYTVTWTTASASTSYTLQEQVNGGSWATIQTSSSTSRAINGKSNGNYGYRAQACNAGGCGPWSSSHNTVVTLPPSTAPILSVATSSTTGSYTVSWTAVSDANSYVLQEQVNGGSWTAYQSSTTTSRAIGYKVNGTYGYRVQACNGSGCGPWTSVKSIGVAIPPPVYASAQVKLNGTWHPGSIYQSSPAFTNTYECVYQVTVSYAGLAVTLTSPTATASGNPGTATVSGTFLVGSGHFTLTATGSHVTGGSTGSTYNRCQGAISGP